ARSRLALARNSDSPLRLAGATFARGGDNPGVQFPARLHARPDPRVAGVSPVRELCEGEVRRLENRPPPPGTVARALRRGRRHVVTEPPAVLHRPSPALFRLDRIDAVELGERQRQLLRVYPRPPFVVVLEGFDHVGVSSWLHVDVPRSVAPG